MFGGMRMGRKVLGLEISEASIKFAIVNNGAIPELLHCNEVNIAAYFGFSQEMLEQEESLLSAISDIIKDMKTENKRLFKGVKAVALCLNHPHTIVRPIKMPALSDNELEAAVEFELSKSFPGIAKTHNISFKEYLRDEQEVSGIVSFAPRELLESYDKFLQTLGYKTCYIDVVANSEAKAFSAFAQSEEGNPVTLLCDLGRSNTLFTILQGSHVLHSRPITQGIPVLYELPDSEDFSGVELSEAQLAGFRQSCMEIINQLQQTIEFFNYNQDAEHSITQIQLLGDVSHFPKLLEYFSAKLNLPVRLVTPQDKVKADSICFLRTFSAIGAAIREE